MNPVLLSAAAICIALTGCQTIPARHKNASLAEPMCYSVTREETSYKGSETKLPRIFILHDKSAKTFFPREGVMEIDWIDGPDKTWFQGADKDSFWSEADNLLDINIGNGFSGVHLTLSKNNSANTYEGDAEHYSDVPPLPGTEEPRDKVKLAPAACPAP